jgi:SAM-dependent methyltransferase
METVSKCLNCNSTNIKFYVKVPDRHYGIPGVFNIDTCKDCRLVFLNPLFNDDEAKKFYSEDDYYAYHEPFALPTTKNSLFQRIKNFLPFKFSTSEIEFNKVGRMLDIGCGNGWVLYQYKAKGWAVSGVEPSKAAADIGNKEDLGIKNSTLLRANFSKEEFDFIRSNHSFEHIYNPNEVLEEIHRILKPDGKLLIGIPNFAGINSKIAKKYWYYLGAPVHPFNYSTSNIKQLLTKHGFKVTRVKYVSGSLGIIGSLQCFLNRENGKKSDEGKLVKSKILVRLSIYLARVENFLRIGDCIEVTAEKNA